MRNCDARVNSSWGKRRKSVVLTRKFEVGFSEVGYKEADNLQLSVLPVHKRSSEFYLSIYLLIHPFGCAGSLLGRGLLLLWSMGSKVHKLSSFKGLVALRHVGC